MTPGYTMRKAVERDIETLVDFTIREAAEAEGAMLSAGAVTRGVRAAFQPSAPATYWVVVAPDGSIAASTSVVMEWSNFRGGCYWWIQSLYIAANHRGRGLIEDIISHLRREARSANALDLRLYVHQSNERAIRAYRKCGFTEGPYKIMSLAPEKDPSDTPDRRG